MAARLMPTDCRRTLSLGTKWSICSHSDEQTGFDDHSTGFVRMAIDAGGIPRVRYPCLRGYYWSNWRRCTSTGVSRLRDQIERLHCNLPSSRARSGATHCCQEHGAHLHPSTPSHLSMIHLHINTASRRTLLLPYSASHVQIRFV